MVPVFSKALYACNLERTEKYLAKCVLMNTWSLSWLKLWFLGLVIYEMSEKCCLFREELFHANWRMLHTSVARQLPSRRCGGMSHVSTLLFSFRTELLLFRVRMCQIVWNYFVDAKDFLKYWNINVKCLL